MLVLIHVSNNRLHATRLQSEVQLLTQEKVKAEEAVEATLEEISEVMHTIKYSASAPP